MPFGGRLLIELATVVVGSKFVAKYPMSVPGDSCADHSVTGSERWISLGPSDRIAKGAGGNTHQEISVRQARGWISESCRGSSATAAVTCG
jgi:hypothetical protein